MRLFVHCVDVKRNVLEALEPGLIIDFEIFVQTKTVSNRDDGRKKDNVCKYFLPRVDLGSKRMYVANESRVVFEVEEILGPDRVIVELRYGLEGNHKPKVLFPAFGG